MSNQDSTTSTKEQPSDHEFFACGAGKKQYSVESLLCEDLISEELVQQLDTIEDLSGDFEDSEMTDIPEGSEMTNVPSDSLSVAMATDETTSANKKSVQFSTVTVRLHPIILGDNPAVSCGPPLSIDWQFTSTYTKAVDVFETTKPAKRRRRPGVYSLTLNRRTAILQSLGYTEKEMSDATAETEFIKQNREVTIKRLPIASVEELAEKMKRTWRKSFPKNKKKHGSTKKSSKSTRKSSLTT